MKVRLATEPEVLRVAAVSGARTYVEATPAILEVLGTDLAGLFDAVPSAYGWSVGKRVSLAANEP